MSRENGIISLSEPEKKPNFSIFYIYEHLKFHAQLSLAWKSIITPGPFLVSPVHIFNHGHSCCFYVIQHKKNKQNKTKEKSCRAGIIHKRQPTPNYV